MKVVNRRSYIAKPGHVQEVVDMLTQEESEAPKRVYQCHYGPSGAVAMELEFSSVDEMEQAWRSWFASEHAQDFLARWYAITDRGGANEVWILH